MGYTSNAELSQALKDGDTGYLCEVVTQIAHGLAGRFAYRIEWDEFGQECCIRVLQNLHKLDPERNLFSYLTQLCVSVFCGSKRLEAKQRRLIEGYARTMGVGGVLGVSERRKPKGNKSWDAQYRGKWIGTYATAEEAVQARKNAEANDPDYKPKPEPQPIPEKKQTARGLAYSDQAGVHYCQKVKGYKKWEAQYRGKLIGRYLTEAEAIQARTEAEANDTGPKPKRGRPSKAKAEAEPKKTDPEQKEKTMHEPTVTDLVALKRTMHERGLTVATLRQALAQLDEAAKAVGGLDRLPACIEALEVFGVQ